MEQKLNRENPRFYFLMGAECIITIKQCLYIVKGANYHSDINDEE